MTVKEALEKEKMLDKLSENLRLMFQNFLNRDDIVLDAIKDDSGMSLSVCDTLELAYKCVSEFGKKYGQAVREAEIGTLNIKY